MKEYSKDFRLLEMMVVAAAREIKDGEKVFVGMHWPVLISLFAKRTHAPNMVFFFESGIIRDSSPDQMPGSWSISDPCICQGSTMCGDSLDTLGMLLHRGLTEVGMLSTSQVDRYGNMNTTCIGAYDKPAVRLPGGGGATDVASLSKRLVIVLDGHEKRRLPEKVNFITTPGYLNGSDSRHKSGLRPRTGPTALITPFGVFRFTAKEKEVYLSTYHPGVSIDKIMENTGWNLKVSNSVAETEPPTKEEIKILRKMIKEANERYYSIPLEV
jgi:glutaconate CoA-transferase subunit B